MQSENVSVLTFCAVPALKARCTFTAVVIDGVRAHGTVLTWIRVAVIDAFSIRTKWFSEGFFIEKKH